MAGDGEADDFLRAVQSQYESLENMGLAISDIRLDVLLFYLEGAFGCGHTAGGVGKNSRGKSDTVWASP